MTGTDIGISWQIDSTTEYNGGFYDISIPEPNSIYLSTHFNYVFKFTNNSTWSKYNIYTQGGYLSSIDFFITFCKNLIHSTKSN